MPDPSHAADQQVAIPVSLQRELAAFRRRLWQGKVAEALAAGVAGLLVSFLIVYALDRAVQTPGWLRLIVLVAGAAVFAGFGPWWVHRWVWRHRREDELARLISKKYPGLGDRLLGVIELQREQDGGRHSARLRAAAMEGVAAEVERRKLQGALPVQRQGKWTAVAGGLILMAVGIFMISPRAGRNAAVRWLLPLSETERYTFTRLDGAPAKIAVPFGEAFVVRLKLAGDSDRRPHSGSARYGLQPGVKAELQGDGYVFRFSGQQEPGTVIFKIGDLRHIMQVEPVQRPSVTGVLAHVKPPPYLGIREKTVDLKAGGLTVVEGSELIVQLTTQRPLSAAFYGPVEGETGEMTIAGTTSRTQTISAGKQRFEIPFTWTDEFGLTGDAGFRVQVDAEKDTGPSVYLQGIERMKVMLPEETVDFELLVEDDFGVKLAGVEWKGEFTRPTDEKAAKGEMALGRGGFEQKRVMEGVTFSPRAIGIGPQKLTLRGYAEDYLPGRGRVYSEPVAIYVLTRDEHAEMLKSNFDRTLQELEDLARRETGLLDDNQRLERLEAQDLQADPGREKLREQEQAEAESTQRMEDLKQRMEKLMQDAARNGEIDKETMRKMADSLKSMQELSQKDLPDVKEKLKDAQDAANTPEKAKGDVTDAVEEQKKALEKMQAAIDSARDANKRFEAGTFVNRLKKAADEQDGIANSLIQVFSKILGVRLQVMDPADQRRLIDATKQQTSTASDVRWLQEDLGHFFARTQLQPFKDILEAMREEKIDLGLDEISKQLQANHSFQATDQSKRWALKLKEWAAKLEGEASSGGGQGGAGAGPSSTEDDDFEFMLRVMKMVQQQQDLRSRTRALEQMRRSASGANSISNP